MDGITDEVIETIMTHAPLMAGPFTVAYGNNYDRLAHIKKIWDPNNLLRSTYNVEPAG